MRPECQGNITLYFKDSKTEQVPICSRGTLMRGPSRKTIELLNFARELLKALNPMTLRQLHYTIFSAAQAKSIGYNNDVKSYRQLSRATTEARERYSDEELAGRVAEHGINPDWIVDETREAEMVSVWDDAADYFETVKYAYRRNLWQDQPAYCEVWSEKGTVLATLRPITQELGLRLRVCHGFGSAGMKHQIAKLFRKVQNPIHIMFLGDHDPSGHDIERDIHAKVERASGRKFTITRLAVHPQDISRFRLPPQEIKPTDSRSPGFKRIYGRNAPTVELDALPVEELRSRVRTAIETLIDWKRWKQQIKAEAAERESIMRIAEQMKRLPHKE
jgi:hypothetical protein